MLSEFFLIIHLNLLAVHLYFKKVSSGKMKYETEVSPHPIQPVVSRLENLRQFMSHDAC
jgi:hypothetical protein